MKVSDELRLMAKQTKPSTVFLIVVFGLLALPVFTSFVLFCVEMRHDIQQHRRLQKGFDEMPRGSPGDYIMEDTARRLGVDW